MNKTMTPWMSRVLVACSPDYSDQRTLMRAFADLLLDTIEGQREYYYLHCPAIDGILDDNVIGPSVFHELRARTNLSDRRVLLSLVDEVRRTSQADEDLHFTHVMTAGEDPFITSIITGLGAPPPVIIRLG